MNATEQPLVKSQGIPAPQYFNKQGNKFEFIEGEHGANAFIQKGTVAMESWQGNANEVRTFPSERFGFSIVNDGLTDVTFTINGNTRVVKKYEVYGALFEPFTAVDIVTTSAYRAEVLR